jgi:hypothetical protein
MQLTAATLDMNGNTITDVADITTTDFHATRVTVNSADAVTLYANSSGATSATWAIVGRDSANNSVFYVRGDKEVWCYNGAWYTSSEQAKENIERIEDVVSGKMLALSGMRFNKIGISSLEAGFIAEDLAQLFPESVREFTHPTGKKELAMKDGPLLAYFSKWGQEQQEMIDSLASRIEDLEKISHQKESANA